MTPTFLALPFAVIYLLAVVQYWVERPTMSPSERRHNGIVAALALVTAILLLLAVFAVASGARRDAGAYQLGPWSFLVLAVPLGQLCVLGVHIARMLHRRQSRSR